MPEVVQHGRFRLAPVARCALDAARRTPDPRACRSLLAAVVQRGDATVADLAQELACAPRRGTAIPHSVVRELGDGAHSVAELDAQRLYAGTGLPPMMRNIDIADAHGRWIARPDGWIDEVALAWEIDSMKFHLSPSLHEGTQRRRARMERFGIVVVSHVPRQLRLEPDVVIADLEAAYRRARERARPAVTATMSHHVR
ncbi:hypothetical protein [Rhodococcus sp. HNM0569]|uniref:hypothetical protein n=1 Tax=Rhodococcus sp. HNM0569 TaxID=2716340 RepID=UPI001F0FFBDB|nr:hypothetical protein [Rhodococcus sp. HNM0569]